HSTVYCDPHSQRLSIVNKTEVDVFLEFLCFLHNLADVGNLISKMKACKVLFQVVTCWGTPQNHLVAREQASHMLEEVNKNGNVYMKSFGVTRKACMEQSFTTAPAVQASAKKLLQNL
uniref:Uncharacterized protein n=1 Tax=Salvator merianae TaxID=96440 RepID=A0A8D0C881_SALMN